MIFIIIFRGLGAEPEEKGGLMGGDEWVCLPVHCTLYIICCEKRSEDCGIACDVGPVLLPSLLRLTGVRLFW